MGPGEPDLVRASIVAAIAARASLVIMYLGGSQPGTTREIRPNKITDDKVRAFDVAAGVAKEFRLAKIRLAAGPTGAPPTPPYVAISEADEAAIDGLTILEYFEPRLADLRALGWHVEIKQDRFSLHGFFKNGKPRKGPEVALLFFEARGDEDSIDSINIAISAMPDDAPDEPTRPPLPRTARRPYYVSSASWPSARTFARLSRAASVVLAEALARAPKRPT